MGLNTRIRGQQINLSDEALDVAVDSIAFKDADDAIKVESIADLATAMAGDGIVASSGVFAVNVGDGIEIDTDALRIDLKANDGLKIDTAELTIAYDDSTIGIISNELAVKDEGITEAKLAIHSAPTDGYVIYWNDGEGKLDYKAIDVEAVLDTDIKYQNESANCDGAENDFTLTDTPVANSVDVYLNGMYQEEGSGKDYYIIGTTITFAIAPESGDILIIRYIASG